MIGRIALALAVALSAACSDPAPDAGEIVERIYDDADEWYQPPVHIPGSCSTTNGVTTCSPGFHTPGIWHSDPERWLLVLDDGEDKGAVSVPEAVWSEVRVGQWFDTETMTVVPR